MNFYKETENLVKSKGFKIISKDFERPWGGFLVIDEDQAQDFSNQFHSCRRTHAHRGMD